MVSVGALRTVHAAFVLTGVVTTLLGPLLPVLVARWSLTDAQAGSLFTAQFTGSMAGVAISGALVRRFGFAGALAAGMTLMAGGVGALGLVAWPHALLPVGCYGIGLGVTIPSTNLFVAEAAPDRRSAALNILNLNWGIGAVAAPPVVAWLAARRQPDAFLFGLAVALLAAMLGVSRLVRSHPALSNARQSPSAWTDAAAASWRWRSPAFIVFGALFFLYVGTENAIAGWVGVYTRRLNPSAAAPSAPTFFWGALLTGRALAPLLLARVDEARLVIGSLFVASIGMVGLLSATSLAAALLSATICGFGLAAVFPTTFAQLSRAFGRGSAGAAAAAFALAGLGGATLPWLVGQWSASTGSLRAGLVIPLTGCVAMIALHAYRARLGAS